MRKSLYNTRDLSISIKKLNIRNNIQCYAIYRFNLNRIQIHGKIFDFEF